MRDSHDDDTEQAYRAAVAGTERDTAALRRKQAVLQAVRAWSSESATDAARADAGPAEVEPNDRPAANEAWWNPSAGWWRGAAAACLIGTSALVVVHVIEEPGTELAAERSAPVSETAEPARPVAAPVPLAAAPVARQQAADDARESLDAPAPAPAQSVAARPAVPASPRAKSMPAPAAGVAAAESTLQAHADRMTEPSSRGSGPDANPVAAANALRAAPGAATSLSAQRQAGSPTSFPREAERRASVSIPPSVEGSARAAAEATGSAPDSLTRVPPPQAPPTPAAARPALAPPASLLAAAAAGDVEAVRRLLQTRAPDAERDADGRTALALAVLRTEVRLVRLLLDKGANRHAPDRLGQTPLGYAQASGNAALLRAFETP